MICGGVGRMQERRSAEPDREVDALFPCLAIMRRDEARIEAVVEMLNVLCESPPVPTMSHCTPKSLIRHGWVLIFERSRRTVPAPQRNPPLYALAGEQ